MRNTNTKEFIEQSDAPEEVKSKAIQFLPMAEKYSKLWLNTERRPHAITFYFDNYNGGWFQYSIYRDGNIKSYIVTEQWDYDLDDSVNEIYTFEPTDEDFEKAFEWLLLGYNNGE